MNNFIFFLRKKDENETLGFMTLPDEGLIIHPDFSEYK